MAAQEGSKNYFTFVGGLHTEASPLTFPENASLDEENFELRADGSRRRRLGLKKESSTSFSPASNYFSTSYAFNSYEWRNPGGVNNLNFVVQQTGRYVNFFEMDSVYSDGIHSDSIDLDDFKVDGATTANVEQGDIDAAYGKGRLIIVGKYIEPLLVLYNPSDETINVSPLTLVERDFEGYPDGFAVDFRPASNTTLHTYNLLNQGWTQVNIAAWDTARADFPSNADIEHLGYFLNPGTGTRDWSTVGVLTYPTNTPAPKGHFSRHVFDTTQVDNYTGTTLTNTLISPSAGTGTVTFTITTSSAHGLSPGDPVTIAGTSRSLNQGGLDGTYEVIGTPSGTTYTVQKAAVNWAIGSWTSYGSTFVVSEFPEGIVEPYRCTATAFHAGRIWYAGTESARIGDVIHFSKVLESEGDEARCQQVQDPTAEEFNELLATDGGTIRIPGMGHVRKMLSVGTYLCVLTSVGCWAVGPGDDGFFKATSFTVRQIANVGCASKQSVVVAEGTPLFWSDSGIYSIVEDKVTGYLTTQSISANTIQTFYNGLGSTVIASAKGVYDDLLKRVLWLYKDENGDFLRILVMEARLNAFAKWRLYNTDDTDVKPVSISVGAGIISNDVGKVRVAYRDVVTGNSVYYWASFSDDTFEDFEATDASAFLITGYELVNDARKPKFTNYINVYLERTEDGFTQVGPDLVADHQSSCRMQARWDWANSSAGGKFGPTQQVYRYRRPYIPSGPSDTFDTGETVITTKNRVTGTGKALHLKFNTEPSKDCRLLGWTVGLIGASRE